MSDYFFLYVEDDPMSREVMTMLMGNVLNYPIEIFEDSANFVERYQALERQPDVIFLDIHMEPIDGYEILRILREDLQLKDVIIIAMTASVMAVDVEQLKEAGFSGLLGKPIRNRTFPEMLERILDGEPIWYIS